MKIAVIGTGYVGLVSGTCLAELGHKVVCIDNNKAKIAQLVQGHIPIYEPGLEALVRKHEASGRLSFSDQLAHAVQDVEVVILAVGTPTNEKTGRADLTYVFAAAKEVARAITKPTLIVVKSTVPVGTGQHVFKILRKYNPSVLCQVASNPEFLREGSAVEDFLKPERIIVGTVDDVAKETMNLLYEPLIQQGYPLLHTNIVTSELIKYASNAFLATKIAFANEMADICEGSGANIELVVKGMGMDARIGSQYMKPAPGYGGSCFPKDTLALTSIAKDAGSTASIVEAVIRSNGKRKYQMANKVAAAFDGKLKKKTLAILGLTFKANTDDMRYSPSLPLIEQLLKKGAHLKLYDPVGMQEAKKIIGNSKQIQWCKSLDEATAGADGCVIVTEWDEFKQMSLTRLKTAMAGLVLIDLRNILAPDVVKDAGFDYVSIGR